MQTLKLRAFEEKSLDFSSTAPIIVEYAFEESLLRLKFHLPRGMKVKECNELSERADGLWERTCFECFISYGNNSYEEWNFSLTGQWQNYFFDEYRTPQPPHRGEVNPLTIDYFLKSGQLYLEIPLKGKPHAFNPCAVIDGAKFFAASHGSEKADFHDFESFTPL